MKRILDVFITISGLIVIIPLFIIISLLVLVNLGRPILFSQIRAGKDGKPFKLYKFRTMTNEVDENGSLLSNELRMNRFGNILRQSSLDEIPEFYCVLKGDMSLVGPRPLLMDYLPIYNDFQKRRHQVKPGITGWAQINGRNALTWNDKFEFDIWYLNNQSFWLDLKIIWLTLYKVFKREGINHKENVTMPRFTGKDPEY